MLGCVSCSSGRTLEPNEIQSIHANKAFLNEETKCNGCGDRFPYVEGIIQGIISDSLFAEWNFVSNIVLSGSIKVSVGTVYHQKLEQEVPVINKIFLTCIDTHTDVAPVYDHGHAFRVISSATGHGAKIGDTQKIDWLLYGRTKNIKIPVWQKFIIQAKEELLQRQYNLSLLTSAISFESFVDTLIEKLFSQKGITQEASNIILESMSGIYHKVHKLLPELDKIALKENKEINKKWQKSVVEKRNTIAHGAIEEVSKEEAREAFETVIRAIYYLAQNTSLNLK